MIRGGRPRLTEKILLKRSFVDRKSTRLNSSHSQISYAVFCLKKNRVLIANSNLVGQWSNYYEFNRLEPLGLTMYGQMTSGSWIYIGRHGIVPSTFETFAAAGA